MTLVVALGLAAPAFTIAACGARSELLVPEYVTVEPDGAIVPVADANVPEEGEDASEDVVDDLPQIDTNAPDVYNPVCADASDTLIYVVTTSSRLLRFDPQSATFTTIGFLDCPAPANSAPFSMAVDRTGVAYVLYFDGSDPGSIFRVSLADASCTPSTYVPGQGGFASFGMAFTADTTDTNETLYVASDDTASGELGAIDEKTLTLTPVGSFSPPAPASELTGTADGRLFGFFAPGGDVAGTVGMTVAQIDKTNATLTAQNFLPTVTQGNAWAFAFWGGNFYLFTAPDDLSSVVTRYNPNDGSLTNIATWPERIDGAGVSTCAPAR
jgi:hypothetical protein